MATQSPSRGIFRLNAREISLLIQAVNYQPRVRGMAVVADGVSKALVMAVRAISTGLQMEAVEAEDLGVEPGLAVEVVGVMQQLVLMEVINRLRVIANVDNPALLIIIRNYPIILPWSIYTVQAVAVAERPLNLPVEVAEQEAE
jgi:hypothetical protein